MHGEHQEVVYYRKKCCKCHCHKLEEEFSITQWSLGRKRKCALCINKKQNEDNRLRKCELENRIRNLEKGKQYDFEIVKTELENVQAEKVTLEIEKDTLETEKVTLVIEKDRIAAELQKVKAEKAELEKEKAEPDLEELARMATELENVKAEKDNLKVQFEGLTKKFNFNVVKLEMENCLAFSKWIDDDARTKLISTFQQMIEDCREDRITSASRYARNLVLILETAEAQRGRNQRFSGGFGKY